MPSSCRDAFTALVAGPSPSASCVSVPYYGKSRSSKIKYLDTNRDIGLVVHHIWCCGVAHPAIPSVCGNKRRQPMREPARLYTFRAGAKISLETVRAACLRLAPLHWLPQTYLMEPDDCVGAMLPMAARDTEGSHPTVSRAPRYDRSCPIADLPARTGAAGWKHDIPDLPECDPGLKA